MRTPSRRCASPWFRPQVLPLEERLPLGDGVLGLLVGAALLPPHAAPALVQPTAQSTSEPGVSGVGRSSNPSVWPDGLELRPTAEALADAPHAALAAPDWAPLTDPFAAARRRHAALFTSPQREQGPEAAPLLALRAGEDRGPVRVFAAPPPLAAPSSHADGVLLATLVGMRASEAPQADTLTPTEEAQVKVNFGQLPLYFEQNVGQTDAAVQFFTRGPGYGLFLTSTEAVMVLNKPQPSDAMAQGAMLSRPCVDMPSTPDCLGRESMPPAATAQEVQEPPAVIRMQLVGGNPAPAVIGLEEQPGKVNYFLGSDPAKWHTNVATFGRVEYDDVYPGIDLVWHGSQRQLEYDFVVSPGADPSVIRLNVSGAERMEIDAAGDLLVHVGEPGGVSPGSTLRQHKPFVYQTVGNTRQEVASRFVLEGHQMRFAVGAYDMGRPLVIDPVLSYSTYLGGSGHDVGNDIAVDPATGDVLLMGLTTSSDFPTANAFQPDYRGDWDAFVTRLRADGAALVWSTYLGGSRQEGAVALALDPATGDALLTGFTRSTNFPIANPLQPRHGGGDYDAFVTRLRADGTALAWSTYLGGSRGENYYGAGGAGIAVDPASGDVLVTGTTASYDFPTVNPLQGSNRGPQDFFVARLRLDGTALVWSTYLGGSSDDVATDLVVDPATGDVLLTGSTQSANFPTANPLQPTHGGGYLDAIVTRLSGDGAALVFSTYLGGNGWDWGYGLAVDPATGDAVVAGETESTNFPTANPLQPTLNGPTDAFVTRLNTTGSAIVWSTYLGGSDEENYLGGGGIAVDPASGDALVTGYTGSSNFPTANPLQASYGGGLRDAFVARLNAAGSALVFSTYLGGSSWDHGWALAVDPASGDALVTGETLSADFPTANPFQPANRGSFDAFVTRIGTSPVAYYYVYPDSGQVTAGVPIDLYVFALDAQFNVIPDYTGLILFYATDPQATTPVYHQFQRTDRGVAYFPGGLTFHTPGLQELYVFDWPGVQVFGYAAFQVV